MKIRTVIVDEYGVRAVREDGEVFAVTQEETWFETSPQERFRYSYTGNPAFGRHDAPVTEVAFNHVIIHF